MARFLKRLLGVLAVIAVVGGALHYFGLDSRLAGLSGGAGDSASKGGGRRGGRQGGGNEAVPVTVAQATVKDVDVYLDGVGTARAYNVVTVKPQVDGKIVAIKFREGQDVKKGDVLAQIDPTTYKAQLDQAVAKKALDEVQLNNARLDYDRYAKVGPNVVTQKQIDTQRALVAQYTAQVQADEAAIANARAILAYTDVVAPIDGRTGLRLVDEGNIVRASADTGIVTITQLKPISVLFTLPQQELPRVTAAMAAGTLSASALDAQGKKPLDTGKLDVVDNQVDQSTGTIKLKAQFPNADLQLWPGQFTNVRLRVEVLKQVVTVPTPAVQRGPSGPFVYTVADGVAHLAKVKIAHQSDDTAVISEGVGAGNEVVTAGFARLRDGAKISVSPDGAAPDSNDKTGRAAADTVSSAEPETGAAPTARAAEFRAGQPASDAASEHAGEAKGEHKRGEGRRRRHEAAQ